MSVDISPERIARDVLFRSGNLEVLMATIRVAPQERMAWLVRAFGNPRDGFHLWPALVQPSATTVQTIVGPFADIDLELGMFLRIAKRRELTPRARPSTSRTWTSPATSTTRGTPPSGTAWSSSSSPAASCAPGAVPR